jgi:histidinol-phosphate/aromatic aminotransferase/cobyric acid decarboxylase-like protein
LDFAVGGFESSLLNTADLERFPNLIVIKSIGKSYGVGGLRLGVMTSSDESLVNRVKSAIPIWNINSVAEFYLQIIGKYSSLYKKSCYRLIETREELFHQLQEIPYLVPYESQANYIFCKVIDKDAHQLAIDLCEKYSILIKDCSGKSSVDGQYIRVAVRDFKDNQLLINGLKLLL